MTVCKRVTYPFEKQIFLVSLRRTSDSLNEELPIKMAKEKFLRKRFFPWKG